MGAQADEQHRPKGAVSAVSERTGGDWQGLLRDHARRRWGEILDSLKNGKPIPRLDEAALAQLVIVLGPQANEALRLVDRLAMGAATEAFANDSADISPGEEFSSQLGRILEGFTPGSPEFPSAPRDHGPPRLFQSELWQLLHKVRESAELSYAREIDLVELDRRILFLLKTRGPLVPAGLSSAIGVDKAQVSRSVKTPAGAQAGAARANSQSGDVDSQGRSAGRKTVAPCRTAQPRTQLRCQRQGIAGFLRCDGDPAGSGGLALRTGA
ncbi:hypothetical protein [Erythrobacter sp. SG61-1L]|uniref:hypothetical protein n=1 Tax=Erythrobacter sp. SG61-1L TaxID=1603897 RepID=UPI0012E29069|nr:hypothetical protein [Erythrobacter sp. SG61-1L]